MAHDFRSYPAERIWESPDTLSIQVVTLVLDSDTDQNDSGDRAVVLPEEDGVAIPGSFAAGFDGRWGRRLGRGFGVRAGIQAVSENREGADDVRVGEAEIDWTGNRHRWALGRSRLRWGAGSSGSLLIGGTAAPRWQLRWRTERALQVPTFGWSTLADMTWTGSFFLAYLDDTLREIDDPLVLGHRLSLQPWPWFEITGTRTILFGGEGRTSRLTPRGILDILIVRNENLRGERPASDSDQRAAYELRLRPPVERWGTRWQGLELYWEYAGEDVNDPPLPSAVAHHVGILTRVSNWTLLLEGAETVTGLNRWYDHTLYGREAYAYRGFLLGHSMGGDARMWELTVWTPPGPIRGKIAFREEQYGFFRSDRETRHVWELGVRGEVRPGLVLETQLARTGRQDANVARRSPDWARHRGEIRLTWFPGERPGDSVSGL